MSSREQPPPHGDLACSEEVEMVTDYLSGALSERQRRRLEAHLEQCPGCLEYVEQMRELAGSLGGLREEAIPPRLRAGLIDSFRELRRGGGELP